MIRFITRRKFPLPFPFPRPLPHHFSTLHEESAAGLNGRLARLPANELLAFHARLSASQRKLLNLASFNYVLAAMLQEGRQMDAFRLISELEDSQNFTFPNRESFTIIMRGLVEADHSGSLALAVDELFELMQRRYGIQPDLPAWTLRIRAFLHPKFMNQTCPALEPTRIFYNEMLETSSNTSNEFNYNSALNDLNAELIVTAVNRRLWTFSDWILTRPKEERLGSVGISSIAGATTYTGANTNTTTSSTITTTLSTTTPSTAPWASSIFIDKIASAAGLFTDPASVPILRFLYNSHPPQTKSSTSSVLLNTVGFNRQVLLFCWRQGRATADLALKALRWLTKHEPAHMDWWIETAEGCLRREMPRDFYVLEMEESKERLAATVSRIKCADSHIKELEREILHQKMFM